MNLHSSRTSGQRKSKRERGQGTGREISDWSARVPSLTNTMPSTKPSVYRRPLGDLVAEIKKVAAVPYPKDISETRGLGTTQHHSSEST